MDLVSIIVPVYNMETFVNSGVDSLCSQTYSDMEILLIDDGSTDNSLAACKKAAEKDNRIRVFSKENGGAGSARNLGIENARGKYMYFHDIDDYIYPTAIERLVNAAEEKDADIVVCGFEMFDGENVTKTVKRADGLYRTGNDARADFYDHCFMYGEKGILGAAWGKLFQSDLIIKNNIRYPNILRNQDEVFMGHCVNFMNSVYFIGDVLCRYYVNTSNRLWNKLPKDYYLIACTTFEFYTDMVCKWNPQNKKVTDKAQQDFFYKTFLSMWEQLNPRHRFSVPEQYRRVKGIAEDYLTRASSEDFGRNDNHVLDVIRKRKFVILYLRLVVYTIFNKNKT